MTAPTAGNLIAGGRVAGTAVCSLNAGHIGGIEDVIIGKATGRVACAVPSFGGFLGIASKHHPLPWDMLCHDTTLGGHGVALDKARLENAPAVEEGWHDRRRALLGALSGAAIIIRASCASGPSCVDRLYRGGLGGAGATAPAHPRIP
jgi:hypothetical protein